jgi:threonine aldolase
MKSKRWFASDNNAGVHPNVMRALQEENHSGHAVGYGSDPTTAKAVQRFRDICGDAEIFFVFAGTPANVLGLRSMASSYHGVICSSLAHMHGSECGASENFIGCKLLPIATRNGKFGVESLKQFRNEPDNPHSVQPKVVSLTQATEYGTIYTLKEVAEIAEYAHSHGWLVHMDGARIANALARLNVAQPAAIGQAGVDVLTFGGTKNGMMFGEAVIFFNPKLAEDFPYIRMQGMQLASKMRFISAQFLALLENGLWLENARCANDKAELLRYQLGLIPEIEFTQETETNQVFAKLPKVLVPALQEEFFFYVWDDDLPERHLAEVRFVTSFDTTREDVIDFCDCIRKALEKTAEK